MGGSYPSNSNLFEPYLDDHPHFHTFDSNAFDGVPPGHTRFSIDEQFRLCPIHERSDKNDEYVDQLDIHEQRRMEQSAWETFREGERAVFYHAHCASCGALGAFSKESQCCLDGCLVGPIMRPRGAPIDFTFVGAATIWIPNEHSGWAAHRIVEAVLNPEDHQFAFVKVRFDKKKANSLSIAKSIIASSLSPLSLSDLAASIPQLPYRQSVVGHTTSSSFSGLRQAHKAIKRMLYIWHGGRHIVDVCAGNLHDLQNWVSSGAQKVLAIDRDSEFLSKGKGRVAACPIGVLLCQRDMSEPPDKSFQELLLGPRYDAAFCNFALHYIWDGGSRMQTFLSNVSSLLRPGARFVITFMQGELVRERSPIQIRNREGELEFEVVLVGEDKCQVFILSIGRSHLESLIEIEPIVDSFATNGFEFLGMLPFDVLSSLLPSNPDASMGAAEREMASLYAAAVFKKSPPDLQERQLPNWLYPLVLAYLDTPSLVKARRLSIRWRAAVDSLDIKVPKHNHAGWRVCLSLPPPSLGLMKRLKANKDPSDSEFCDSNDQSRWFPSDHDDSDIESW